MSKNTHMILTNVHGADITIIEPLTSKCREWVHMQGRFDGRIITDNGCLVIPFNAADKVLNSARMYGLHVRIEAGLCPICGHNGSRCTGRSKNVATLSVLIRAINSFLDANGKVLRGDARLYTKSEWRKRGEPYGNNAVCTLVIDGSPMYDVLNYGGSGWQISERFHDMLGELGYWYELGFAWSVHIYRQ